jgi:hypothetical protein
MHISQPYRPFEDGIKEHISEPTWIRQLKGPVMEGRQLFVSDN